MWCILILTYHLHLCLQSGPLASDPLTKILCEFLIASIRATYPANLILTFVISTASMSRVALFVRC